ncbi:MAG: Gfo/Idh/MocA family protein, partial [Thermoguttaceae bacterium]
MKNSNFSRRTFLGASAATVAAPYFVPRTVLGKPGEPGANETVKVGMIGLGGRCHDVYANSAKIAKGAKVVACCDPFQPKIDGFIAGPANGDGLKGYDDFRDMIEKEKLDAVMVETATHQRAWVSIIAMMMGAHAYIEKPMCLTIAEGREMVKAARKFKRVTQVGTQQRSLPLCKWASKLVQDGAIGKVKYVRAPNFVGPNI